MTEQEAMEIRDCHYCEYAFCGNAEDEYVDCYVDDYGYFDHHVTDSKEAEECDWFVYNNNFPKY